MDTGWVNAEEAYRMYPYEPFLSALYAQCTIPMVVSPGRAVSMVTALLDTTTSFDNSPGSLTSIKPQRASRTTTQPPSALVDAASPDSENSDDAPGPSGAIHTGDSTATSEGASDNQARPTSKLETASPKSPSKTSPKPWDTLSTSPRSCTNVGCIIASVIGAAQAPGNHETIPTATIARETPSADEGGKSSNAATNTKLPDQGESTPPKPVLAGSSTLRAGGPAVVVSGTTFSLPPEGTAIIVNGRTSAVDDAQESAPSKMPDQLSVFAIGEATVLPGSTVTVSGTTYALPKSGSGISIDGTYQPFSSQSAGLVLTTEAAQSTTIKVRPGFIIEGQTLAAGSDVVVSGTTYSLPGSGSEILVDGHATTLSSGDQLEDFTIGSVTVVPTHFSDATGVTGVPIGEQTLIPGSGFIVSGTTYSLPTDGSEIYINGHATLLPSAFQGQPLIIHSATETPSLPSGKAAEIGYLIGGVTLSPGSSVEISGTTYSLPSTKSEILVNGQASSLPPISENQPFAIGSATLSPTSLNGGASQTGLLLDGKTLAPGSSIVVSGTTFSWPTAGQEIFVNGQATELPSPTLGRPLTIGSAIATPTLLDNDDSQSHSEGPNATDTSSEIIANTAKSAGQTTTASTVSSSSSTQKPLKVFLVFSMFLMLLMFLL